MRTIHQKNNQYTSSNDNNNEIYYLLALCSVLQLWQNLSVYCI